MKLQVSQPHTKPVVVVPNIISVPCDTEEPGLQRNKGNGAGGRNTTVNGSAFEQHCSFEKALENPDWYIRYAFYIENFLEDQYTKNWKHIRTILKDDAIPCWLGSDPNAQRAILDYVGIFPHSE